MKIGIPRALLYYYYIPFWKAFFEALNMEVLVSNETNKGILNLGVKESVAEICVPIKLFVGHSLSLLRKGADYIFVPRMVSIYKGEYFCPKFMGLPDMMRHGVKGMENKVLTCHITSEDDDISNFRHYLPLAEPLGVTESQIKQAAQTAGEKWKIFRMYNKMGYTAPQAMELMGENQMMKRREKKQYEIRIGLIGYVYNIYDPFISMNMVEKLQELNVDFVTFEMQDEKELREYIEFMPKKLFWTFSNKLLGAGYKFLEQGEIDGLIHITAFGCGPDSFLSKLLEMKSDEVGIPFMMIRVDEHTGENHLQTRIEAFIDMLKRKKMAG